MRIEWPKDMTVMVEVACGVLAGGLTAQQRTSLANRVGISEEVLLRYERARQACHDLIFRQQMNQAWSEAAHRMRELGKRMDDPAFPGELEKAVHRIRKATPENAITRERDEALAAVRAAIAASEETKESRGDDTRRGLPISKVAKERPIGALSYRINTGRGSVGACTCPDRLPGAAAPGAAAPGAAAGDDGYDTDFRPRQLSHRQGLEYATAWLPLGSETCLRSWK